MQIQNSNMRYTGSYSILNANRGSSFPYAMKVDGGGTLGNRKIHGQVHCTQRMESILLRRQKVEDIRCIYLMMKVWELL